MPFDPALQRPFQQAQAPPPICPAAPAAERRWSTRRLFVRAALAAILFLGLAGPSEAKCAATIHVHSGQCWYICYFVGQEPDGTCDYDYCEQTGCN